MNSLHRLHDYRRQRGITLFTALMFLIMLSLLGVNAAQMASLEEHMSGNSRNRELAFEQAEYVLKFFATGNNLWCAVDPAAVDPTTNANCAFFPTGKDIYNPAGPSATDTTTWGTGPNDSGKGLQVFSGCYPNSASYWNNTNTSYACPGTVPGNTSYPVDTTTNLWSANQAQTLSQTNQIAGLTAPTFVIERLPDSTTKDTQGQYPKQYRITVRAVGGDPNAVVILQAMFCLPSPNATCQ